MDAEDTHDGGRNHRPYMDSFGVDKFQSIVEKIFNNSRTLRNIASERLVRVEEKVNHISDILLSNGEEIDSELDDLQETIKDLNDRLRIIETSGGTTNERLAGVVSWKTETNNKIESLQGWVSRIQGILAVIGFFAVLIAYAFKDYLMKLISS